MRVLLEPLLEKAQGSQESGGEQIAESLEDADSRESGGKRTLAESLEKFRSRL